MEENIKALSASTMDLDNIIVYECEIEFQNGKMLEVWF